MDYWEGHLWKMLFYMILGNSMTEFRNRRKPLPKSRTRLQAAKATSKNGKTKDRTTTIN